MFTLLATSIAPILGAGTYIYWGGGGVGILVVVVALGALASRMSVRRIAIGFRMSNTFAAAYSGCAFSSLSGIRLAGGPFSDIVAQRFR